MNPELLKKIKQFNLDKKTSKSYIRAFLNIEIPASMYSEIEGVDMEEKVETIYNYLNEVNKEPEIKQILNIVIADDSSSLEYISYLNQKYEVIVHKSKDVKDVKDIDLVLFTGGADINPQIYGEEVGKFTQINKNRDSEEIDVFDKFVGYSFLLGICRGNQLLTALSGGRLIQHVEGHCKDHSIIVNNTTRYNMTSSHHQMIYPFNLNEKNYELIAYSEYFQSKTYLNGNNEEVELSNNFIEPEIVYYKNTDALCIQGHPEWSHCDKRTSNMCLNLIDKYLKEFKKSKELNASNYSQKIILSNIKRNNNYFEDMDEGGEEEENEEL